MQAGCIRFHRVCFIVMLLGFSGSPESRTQRHPVISRVRATGPRPPCVNVVVRRYRLLKLGWHALSRKGRGGRPDTRSLHSRACHPLPTSVSFMSGWQESNLRLRAPKARGFAATLHPVFQSERPDLNRRSPGPRPRAIPVFATFCSQWPIRESNPSSRLEKPMSFADRRRGHLGAYFPRS